jgi:hypothetical protein
VSPFPGVIRLAVSALLSVCLLGASLPASAKERSAKERPAKPRTAKPQTSAKDRASKGVTIESSAQGTITRPGSRVTVTVRLDPKLKASRVSLLMGTWEELIYYVDEVPPYEFVIPIDRKWSGPMRIMCSVLSARDKLIGSGELLVNVVPLDLPVSIAVTDPVRMVAGSAPNRRQEHINVRGTFADGTVRDVGRLDLGTSFHSSDARVVAVDGEGFLTAGVPGHAVVTVKNGTLSEVVPVHVQAGPGGASPPVLASSQPDARSGPGQP